MTDVKVQGGTVVRVSGAGPAGVGVPPGGTAGQSLVKVTDDNFDTGWSDQAGGSYSFVNLTDTPGTITADGIVVGNALGDGLEFVTSLAISQVADLQSTLNDKLDLASVSVFGESLIDDADASEARATLELGTAAISSAEDFATAEQGIPAGGSAGQIFTKLSEEDYVAGWSNISLSASVYVRADATGTGDGSSWTNAYTSLTDALAAINAGDILYTDGDFYEQPGTITAKHRLTIVGNVGPSGQTRIFGIRIIDSADVTDNGGNVFSFVNPETGDPATVTWDYQQDDTLGTVTGVTVMDAESVAAAAGTLIEVPSVRAWYGHLRKVSPTTTPGSGEWSMSGESVYVNPPEAVGSTVDFAAGVGVGRLGNGIALNACDDVTIRGVQVIAFGDENTQRGSFYTTGCLRLTLDDCVSYDAGYRGFNIEGATGDDGALGHRITGCLSAGDWARSGNTNNYFVVYNAEGAPGADVVFTNCHAVMYPWLETTGRPMAGSVTGETHETTQYRPVFFYSHVGGSAISPIGDILFDRCAQWSQCQNLNSKHASLGMFWQDEAWMRLLQSEIATTDYTDPDDYAVVCRNCLIVGDFNNCNVRMDSCRMIVPSAKGGLSSYARSVTPESTSDYDWVLLASNESIYWRMCEVFAYGKDSATGALIRGLNNSTSLIYVPGCTIVYWLDSPSYDSNCIFRPGPEHMIYAPGCVFVSTGTGTGGGALGGNNRHFMRYNTSTPGADWPTDSYGGKTFDRCWWYGFSETFFFRNSSTTSSAYSHFADTAGGSPIDNTDHVFAVDPEFVDESIGDITPVIGGALDAARLSSGVPDLWGLVSVGGVVYGDRYGSYQGIVQAHSHPLSDIIDAGTAAVLDVPASGDASASEVVRGDDTRLTDARTPTSHTHTEADITDLGAYLIDAPSDGSQYGRQNGAWAVISGGGGGTQRLNVMQFVLRASASSDGTSSTNAQTVPYDTFETLSSGLSYSDSGGEITILEAGTWIFTYEVTTSNSSSNTRSESEIWFEIDGGSGFVKVDDSASWNYNRQSSQGKTTSTATIAFSLDAGSDIRVRYQTDSAAVFSVANACRLMIYRLITITA